MNKHDQAHTDKVFQDMLNRKYEPPKGERAEQPQFRQLSNDDVLEILGYLSRAEHEVWKLQKNGPALFALTANLAAIRKIIGTPL